MSATQQRNTSRLPDHDMQSVSAALVRSALRARELASRTGTPLIITRDGKVVEQMIAPLLQNSSSRNENGRSSTAV